MSIDKLTANNSQIVFTHPDKEETKYVDLFIKSVFTEKKPSPDNLTIESPDETNRSDAMPDYYIPELDTCINVKRLVFQEILEGLIVGPKTEALLNKEILERDVKTIRGQYEVCLPYNFKIKRAKASDFIDLLLNAYSGQSIQWFRAEVSTHSGVDIQCLVGA